MPPDGTGIEIGAGTGRFSLPLIEPFRNMAQIAAKYGIQVIQVQAETLPVYPDNFDVVLMVTTICFLNNLPLAFEEVHQILRSRGVLLIGIIDRNSALGRKCEENKTRNPFSKRAAFYTAIEIIATM